MLYGISSLYAIFLLRRGFRTDNRINYFVLMAGALFHTVAMFQRGFSLQRCPINNLYEATIFVAWTIVASYLTMGAWTRLRYLGAFASPVLFGIGVFALMPSLDAPHEDHPVFTGGWMSLHAAFILLAYGGFGLSAVAAVMYLFQEHNLKYNKPRAVLSLMPPMQRLEVVNGRMMIAGFALLTAGLGFGVVYLKETHDVFFKADPKILWSLLVWSACLAWLIWRWGFAQRGRRLAWGTVGVFAFVLLTFWGSNLLSSIHNPPPESAVRGGASTKP